MINNELIGRYLKSNGYESTPYVAFDMAITVLDLLWELSNPEDKETDPLLISIPYTIKRLQTLRNRIMIEK